MIAKPFGVNTENLTMRALLFVLLIIPSFTFAQSLDTTFSELAKELATL